MGKKLKVLLIDGGFIFAYRVNDPERYGVVNSIKIITISIDHWN